MFGDVDNQLSIFYFQILKSSKRDMTEIIFEGSAPMEQEGLFAYAAYSGSKLTERYVTRLAEFRCTQTATIRRGLQITLA